MYLPCPWIVSLTPPPRLTYLGSTYQYAGTTTPDQCTEESNITSYCQYQHQYIWDKLLWRWIILVRTYQHGVDLWYFKINQRERERERGREGEREDHKYLVYEQVSLLQHYLVGHVAHAKTTWKTINNNTNAYVLSWNVSNYCIIFKPCTRQLDSGITRHRRVQKLSSMCKMNSRQNIVLSGNIVWAVRLYPFLTDLPSFPYAPQTLRSVRNAPIAISFMTANRERRHQIDLRQHMVGVFILFFSLKVLTLVVYESRLADIRSLETYAIIA